MKNRPWPVVFLAALHILSPIGNILMSAWIQKMQLPAYWTALIHSSNLLSLVSFFLALPLAGVALFLYREWSYGVVFGAMTLSIFTNFQSWSRNPSLFPLWLFALVVAIDLALLAYFLLPSVWAPYMDPKMRWWETKPRYRIKQRAQLFIRGGLEECLIADFSEGGAMIKCRRPMTKDDEVELRFPLAGRHFHFRGKVVYQRSGNHSGCGIRFEHSPETLCEARKLVAGFHAMEIPRRNARTLRDDLRDWIRKFSEERPMTPQSGETGRSS